MCRAILTALCCLALVVGGVRDGNAQATAITATSIRVNTTADELNSDGDCSLREAVIAANIDAQVDACLPGSGEDVILLPAGTFTLFQTGLQEDDAITGDLDIIDSLTIVGISPRDTILNGNHSDRIFEVIGAITLKLSKLTLTNGWITDDGMYGGGAIQNNSVGTIDLYQVVLRANTSSNLGGAIDNAGNARLNYVTLDGNLVTSTTANCSGGAIFNVGKLDIYNSILSNNTVDNPDKTDYGGGIFSDGKLTMVNVTFSHNTADLGGGLAHQGTEANLYNITFSDNSTTVYASLNTNIRIKNSIFANCTAGEHCNGDGAISSLGHNIEDTDSCDFDLKNTDPLLGPLVDNLGPTLTHALLAGSPAIDNADPTDCPATDQRGAFRPADGDLNGSSICDIGAYEALAQMPILIYLPILSK